MNQWMAMPVLTVFRQDVYPWTDPDTGEVHEPSWDWFANLTAARSDGIPFFVRVRIRLEDYNATENKVGFVQNLISMALFQLDSYRDCSCSPQKACSQHVLA